MTEELPRIAYLVNRYPAATHTFIRREIDALEATGTPVRRYALRIDESTASDPVWREEAAKVRSVTALGPARLTMATMRQLLADPSRFFRTLAKAFRLGWHSNRGLALNLAYFVEACAIVGMFADDGIEHVHVHFGTNGAAVALLSHRLGGPTWSFTTHGPAEYDDPLGMKLGEKVAEAHAAIAISDFGRSQLYRWSDPSHWPRIHVIRCSVDERYLDAPRTPVPDVPRFVSVGRLVNQKGQVLLVQAVDRLLAEGTDVELVLIGEGPSRPEVEAAIAATSRPEAIRLTGSLPNEQVAEHMRASRALVLPNFAEGLPVVLMEAMALGRPVITTAIAGIPELVAPGSNGWLVHASDIESLVDAMREALATPVDELTTMGSAGAAAVAEHHRAATEAARLRALFPVPSR